MISDQHGHSHPYRWSRIIFLIYVVLIFPLLGIFLYLDTAIELSDRELITVMVPCMVILSINLLILLFQPRWISKIIK